MTAAALGDRDRMLDIADTHSVDGQTARIRALLDIWHGVRSLSRGGRFGDFFYCHCHRL
ncbi:hypothetical protein [Salinisphaera sp. Q1T1-3]|uniref:hypothetical protein n=1 Tax=Salinisphaera sp. Q1T1-3 TaxID=2321229 RepID=UPI001F22FDC6|nr:hypothetical protein [Salinisphaera sp. Q1T1-3]